MSDNNVTRKDLVLVIKEFNDVMGLDPQIPTRNEKVESLEKNIREAFKLIEPEDTFSEQTQMVLSKLGLERKEEKEEKENGKKEEKKTKPAPSYNGRMTQFIDNLLFKGGSWEEILKEIKEEAKKRGIAPEKYTQGTLNSHIRYREKNGFPGKGHPKSIKKTEKGIEIKF